MEKEQIFLLCKAEVARLKEKHNLKGNDEDFKFAAGYAFELCVKYEECGIITIDERIIRAVVKRAMFYNGVEKSVCV